MASTMLADLLVGGGDGGRDRGGRAVAAFARAVSALREALGAGVRLSPRHRAIARHEATIAWLAERALAPRPASLLLEEAVALTARTLDVERCAVFENAPEGTERVLRHGWRWPEGAPREASATVAIGAGAEPYGVLSVATGRRRGLTAVEIRFLERVAAILARAVERDRALAAHQLHEARLEQHAFYDDLTDLPNRALFGDRLRHALRRARRTGGSVSLLYIDLDGFKGVNDTFGHAAGDRVLQQAAARLRGNVRGNDTTARLGGDEFAVILDGAEEPEAILAAQRVTAAFRAPFLVGDREVQVSASVGVASATCADDLDPELLVARADEVMYQAKRQGGGRAPDPGPSGSNLVLKPEDAPAPPFRWPHPGR